MCTHFIIEPVEITESLQIFARETETKAFSQHLMAVATFQCSVYFRLHFLRENRQIQFLKAEN